MTAAACRSSVHQIWSKPLFLLMLHQQPLYSRDKGNWTQMSFEADLLGSPDMCLQMATGNLLSFFFFSLQPDMEGSCFRPCCFHCCPLPLLTKVQLSFLFKSRKVGQGKSREWKQMPEAAEVLDFTRGVFLENSGSPFSLLVGLLFSLSLDQLALVCRSEVREGCSRVEQRW